MRFLISVLIVAGIGIVFAIFSGGYSDLLMLVIPVFTAALILVIGRLLSGGGFRITADRWAFVDGSNVMYWRDNTPSFEPLHAVIGTLRDRGFTPIVMFDANAGYLLTGRYMHHGPFERKLGLPKGRVFVVSKGEQADPFLLATARRYNATIVTNDRFRDWAEEFPEVTEAKTLMKGGYRAGTLWLEEA